MGLVIALLSVFLGHLTGIVYFDGAGSVLIGLLLIGVSFFFAVECKSLLIGEGLLEKDILKINQILSSNKHVTAYKRPLSLYFGPQEVLVNLDVDFENNLTADKLEEAIDVIEHEIKTQIPSVNRIFIEAETIKTNKNIKETLKEE